MAIKQIVSCWVTRTVQPTNSINAMVASLHKAGFRTTKEYAGQKVFLKRGSQVGGFDYDSEGLEVQVILEPSRNGDIAIHVGNWGFPFEPLLMRDRFRRLADRIENDIRTHGYFVPAPGEVEAVEAAKNRTRFNAGKIALIAAPIGAIVGFAVVRLLGS